MSRPTANLLDELTEILGHPVDRGSFVATRSPEALEPDLATVGLTARWLHGGPDLLLQETREDLPLVGWVERPRAGGWVIVHGARLGKVLLREVGVSESRWVDPAKHLGPESRSWARVVPLLPASPLGGHGGKTPSPTRRLLGLLRAEQGDIVALVVFAMAVGLLSLATPLTIQLLINWLAFGALLQPILTLSLALVLCLTLVGALSAAQRHAVEIVQRRIFARVVADISARLARVRIAGLDGTYGPELANRFFDVLTLQKAANTLLLDGLAAALQAAVGLLLLAFYHPLLLLFDVVVVGLVAFVLVGLARGAEASAILESKKKYAVAAWLEELALHPRMFKFGSAGLAGEQSDLLVRNYLDARASHFQVFFRQYLGMQAILVLLPASLLVMTSWLVLEGELTLGQLVAAEFIVASALAGVAKFAGKLETVYDLLAGIDKLGALFDLPLESESGNVLPEAGPSRVEVEGLTFSHAAGGALGPVDLVLPARARVGIWGAAGSGKSTLAELVLSLRTPSGGRILRDGIPTESLRPGSLLDNSMLVCGQGLLTASVRSNVVLGRSIDDSRLWEVLEELNLASAIRALPKGLDTTLHPSGAPLSSSIAFGLSVARAVLHQPRLLVVDGVLDQVPDVLAARWLEVLLAADAPWTLLFLTHDPKLAKRCPTSFELREGRLHA